MTGIDIAMTSENWRKNKGQLFGKQPIVFILRDCVIYESG